LQDLGPEFAFHQHLDGAVGQAQHLEDAGQGAQAVDFPFLGLIPAGVFLGAQQDVFFLPHGVLQRGDGAFPADEQGHHHGGEHHDIPQGQQGTV
jgi:hypothetical protein